MNADLQTLKSLCFKQNRDPALIEIYRRSWATYYPIHITHPVSIRMVQLLLKTRITPNQISCFSILTGLAAAFFFARAPSIRTLLTGALLFEISYIFDAVDGQLARARGLGSKGGAFLDEWGNYFTTPLIIFCIGIQHQPQIIAPWGAFFASYTVLAVPTIEILKDRFFFKQDKTTPMGKIEQGKFLNKGFKQYLKFVYSLLYRSCTMPVIMNTVTLTTIFTALSGALLKPSSYVGYLSIVICYYVTVGTIVWLSKVIYLVKKG